MTPSPSPSAPESIVVSLEWAKKLKEAGWPQEDWVFCWSIRGRVARRGETVDVLRFRHNLGVCDSRRPIDPIAAPTAEEILRRLPRHLPWKDDSDNTATLFVNIFPSSYRVGYSPQWTKDAWSSPDAESLADAAAGCYCYLAEQKLLPPSK